MVIKVYAVIDRENEYKDPQYCLLVNMKCLDGVIRQRKMGVNFFECEPEIGNIDVIRGGMGYIELKGNGNDVENTHAYPMFYIREYEKTNNCKILDEQYGGRTKFYKQSKYRKSYKEYMKDKSKDYTQQNKSKDKQIKKQYDNYKNNKNKNQKEKSIEDLFDW